MTFTGPVDVWSVSDYKFEFIASLRVRKNSDNPSFTGIYVYTEGGYKGDETALELGEYKCEYWRQNNDLCSYDES